MKFSRPCLNDRATDLTGRTPLSHSLTLSLTHTITFSLSHSFTHTHIYSHFLSLSLTHTHTLTFPLSWGGGVNISTVVIWWACCLVALILILYFLDTVWKYDSILSTYMTIDLANLSQIKKCIINEKVCQLVQMQIEI